MPSTSERTAPENTAIRVLFHLLDTRNGTQELRVMTQTVLLPCYLVQGFSFQVAVKDEWQNIIVHPLHMHGQRIHSICHYPDDGVSEVEL